MTRRILGVLVAVLLALVGTIALVAYVSSAEQRALAGEQLVEVYVVAAAVPGGTPAENVEEFVVVEQVPVKVRAEGAVDSLAALAGLVTAVDLVPGEQLVLARFTERSSFADREVGIDVPPDLVEVTVELEAQRAAGGLIEAGQTIAVFASFDPFQLTQTVVPVDGEVVPVPAAVAGEVDGSTPNSTNVLLRKVLVTAVQELEERAPAEGSEDANLRLTTAPSGSVFVTMAVTPFNAERLIFTAEFGEIWLGIDRETVPENDEPGQNRGSVLLESRGTR